ncbi:hypothetical protein BLL52_3238 [Rhodoferax antarcticus ANT.BR]|uniref:Uncharacterized protein n=1 Tax=Rhodoferax antarcticus ANT.BR TaxID=1111071 RepID=A0A1Q8YCM4_9BURK|nr:hypothetical protein BLL52_3238 [Rhodoferax antarcticus ANT.BR]
MCFATLYISAVTVRELKIGGLLAGRRNPPNAEVLLLNVSF